MTWGMVAVAGATVVGGVMASNAAGSAADAQSSSAAQADATQRYMYDTTRTDNAPFLNNGTAASNALANRLGLSPSPTVSAPSAASFKQLTGADLIDTSGDEWKPNSDLYANDPSYRNAWDQLQSFSMGKYGVTPATSRGSDAAMAQKQLAMWGFDINAATQARQQPQTATAQVMPQSGQAGSLLRDFSQSDLEADPVYQNGLKFGLNEGTKGINQLAAASGSMLSGATLKALAKYGTDYGSTKANESFNRFNANRDSTYNKLAGMAGSGQTATAQVGAAGQNMANNISQSQLGVGNARAASSIGGTNALVGAMNQGVSSWNGYNQNQAMLNAPGAAFQPNSSWINNNGGGF